MERKSNADLVLEAVQEIHGQEQVVTRETLAELTGLKMSIIDDRVSHLIAIGSIHRVQRGVFVPSTTHAPARIISKTVLPDGLVKIEIGDDHVLTLTPRENRMLGELMAGAGHQASSIETGHQATHMVNEIQQQIRQLQQRLSRMRTSAVQGGLFKDSEEPEEALG